MNADFSVNKLERMAMFLPITGFRLFRRIVFPYTKDSRIIRGYKNKYAGKRCFIIGNGPSLTAEKVEKLKGEITFGTNRIYKLYSETDWRPTFYMAIDNNILKDNISDIISTKANHKFLNVTAKAYGAKSNENTSFVNIFGRYLINPYNFKTKKLSKDVSKSFSLSFSVTGIAMELAFYMGFDTIYLVGVDNTYSKQIDNNGMVITNANVKDYFGSVDSKDYTIQYKDSTISYYSALFMEAKRKSINIFNATDGGKLEVFPRISFEEAIKK